MANIGRSPSYTIRNAHSYCFRMIVPKDIQQLIGKKELRYSLKTGYLAVAKSKSRLIAGNVQQIFQYLRKGHPKLKELSESKIQELIKSYFKKLIDDINDPIPFDKALEQGNIPYTDKNSFRSHMMTLDDAQEDFSIELGSGDFSRVGKEVDKLLKNNDINDIDHDAPQYLKLCQSILKAQIEGINYEKNQMQGKFSDDVGAMLTGISDKKIQATVESDDAPNDSESLSIVISKYVKEAESNWAEKTKQAILSTFKLMIEIIGDSPIQSIKRRTVSDFKQTLMKLPPNMKKLKIYKDKTIPEILTMEVERTLSTLTINDHLQRIGALFDYACKNGYYNGTNPASKIRLPKNKQDRDRRAPYTNEELGRLLRSKQYLEDSHRRSYQYWAPIIALFQGMRLNEIADLHLEHIKTATDGVWIFDLTNTDLKTQAAQRIIPIHPFLLNELNFLSYIETLKKSGEQQLFPELTKGRDGYGKEIGRWFNERYKKKHGISAHDGRKRDFHSFRTTFTTRVRHNNVNDRMLKEVIGHSVNKDVTDRYTDQYPAKVLLDEVIIKADFHTDIDLSHLKKSKYVISK